MTLYEAVQSSWNKNRTENAATALAMLLRLLSIPYRAAVATRNTLYDLGLFHQTRLPCKVISVGNLTVGGTGKTPTVILLARLFLDKGYRPAVLSRGYGGTSTRRSVNIVADGKRVLLGWHDAGDEPLLIAHSVPEIPVLTGPKRILTGQAAIRDFGADILILDDAFQHRALYRDLDIVLVDAARPFGNGRLLPGGPLREPKEAIHRAHLLIRTGSIKGPGQPLSRITALPSFRGFHRPQGILEGATNRFSLPQSLQGRKACAFAGIGKPESFQRTLKELGVEIVSFRTFPDHHAYSRSDIDSLRRMARETGADRMVTTEKDGIRLADFPDFLEEIVLLRIGMEIAPAHDFAEWVFSRLGDGCMQPPATRGFLE